MVGYTRSDLTANSTAWTPIEMLPSHRVYRTYIATSCCYDMHGTRTRTFIHFIKTYYNKLRTDIVSKLVLYKPQGHRGISLRGCSILEVPQIFWAIKTLNRFIRCLESATTAAQGFHDEWLVRYRTSDAEMHPYVDNSLAEI